LTSNIHDDIKDFLTFPKGMYATADTSKFPIRLLQFPYTLAGDGALSIPIQCLITWWIEVWGVNRDLRQSRIQPIGFIREPKHHALRWFMFLDRRERNNEAYSWSHVFRFVRAQLTRGFILSVLSFTVLWGPSVAVLTAMALKPRREYSIIPLPYLHEIAEILSGFVPTCSKD
jgi:hypothetical protein